LELLQTTEIPKEIDMKGNQSIFVPGAVLLLAFAAAGQERKVVEFTGTASMASDPANPNTSYPVRGFVQCIGGGNPAPADRDLPPWCPPGTRTEVKARVVLGKWETSDPNLNGTMRWYLNFQVDSATFAGDWWGSFVLQVPGKGTWEGRVWGETSGIQMNYRLIGIGTGAFDKSTMMAEANFEDWTSKPPTIKGRYLEPKSK